MELEYFVNQGKSKSFEEFKSAIQPFEIYGFKSLMPLFNVSDNAKVEEYENFKLTDLHRIYEAFAQKKSSSAMRIFQEYEEEMESEQDEIIADPYFASILNRNREVEVGGKIYKYTENGLFVANKDNYSNLIEAVDSDLILEPITGIYNTLANGVQLFIPNKIELNGSIPNNSARTEETPQDIIDNLKICGWDPNIWDDIFGPAESCISKFDSDERIKTKAWNQNYGLFSSLGVKVESQNRFLRIWWAEKANELELRYSICSFEYDIPSFTYPTLGYTYTYEYGDYIIDQYGMIQQNLVTPKNYFERFPIEDPASKVISIYLSHDIRNLFGISSSSFDINGADINNAVKSLVKTAYSKVSNALNTQINGKSAVIVFPDNLNPGKLHFVYANWSNNNTNDNKITKTFDWRTAVIGFKTGGSSGTSVSQFDVAKSYSSFQVACYGVGRKGSKWRGSKVILSDVQ